MTAGELVGHDDIDALIMRLRLGTEASELHGSLCGYLAGGGSLRGTSVLAAAAAGWRSRRSFARTTRRCCSDWPRQCESRADRSGAGVRTARCRPTIGR